MLIVEEINTGPSEDDLRMALSFNTFCPCCHVSGKVRDCLMHLELGHQRYDHTFSNLLKIYVKGLSEWMKDFLCKVLILHVGLLTLYLPIQIRKLLEIWLFFWLLVCFSFSFPLVLVKFFILKIPVCHTLAIRNKKERKKIVLVFSLATKEVAIDFSWHEV